MVSIIILSYNTKELLRSCLRSVFAQLKKIDIEVIVVDNASEDESVAMVEKEFRSVRLIKSSKNLGFGKGINLGIREATGESLLFLNSDATLIDARLSKMVAFLSSRPEIGIVGGKLVNSDGSIQRSYSKFYNLPEVVRILFTGDRGERKGHSHDTIKSVDWVSGGFMLIKKDVFIKLGGFDEHFFMYIEDMELCLRAKKAGFATYFYPEAKAAHIGQGSSNRTFAVLYIYQGLVYYYKKHKSFAEYVLVKLLLTGKALLAISIGIITGNAYLIKTYKKAIQYSL